MPVVSIIIPCYNRSKMLAECIDSFLRQRFQDFEIIVGDDGSEEDLSFIVGFDTRIKYFRQERNGYGADRARNKALKYVEGKYILVFDSDDLATSKLLKEEAKFLDKHPEYDAVYSDVIIKSIIGGREKCVFRDCEGTENDYKRMLQQQFIPHGGVMWRKENLPLHDETLPAAGDWELYLTALEQGVKFFHLNKFLWIQRIGHEREAYGQRQIEGCKIVLGRRGYRFNKEKREGIKI